MDCRCTCGEPVDYQWHGESLGDDGNAGESDARRVARWFAVKAANKEFAWGTLEYSRFDKYRMRMEAFLEEKLERAMAGMLFPGTEVVNVERAREKGIPMFEFRWHRDERQLKGCRREQIRHYEVELEEYPDSAFGLHCHLKDVRSGDDAVISAEQNEEIDKAVSMYDRRMAEGWNDGE